MNTFSSNGSNINNSVATNTNLENFNLRHDSTNTTTPVEVSWLRTMQLTYTEFMLSTSQLYTKNLQSTTIPLQIIWFSLSFGSYGLLTWINTLFEKVHLRNIYFNALLFSLSNLPGNILSAFFMDTVGRSRLLSGSILIAAMSLISFAYEASMEDGNDDDSTKTDRRNATADNGDDDSVRSNKMLIVISACVFQCFTISAWNAIDVITSELFPTSVRATGMGVCAATGRIGAMLAQFINGYLVSHPTRLLLVAAGTLTLGSIIPAWLPDDQTGRSVQDYTVTPTPSHDGAVEGSTTVPRRRRNIDSDDNYDNNALGGSALEEDSMALLELALPDELSSSNRGSSRRRSPNSEKMT